MLRCAVTNSLFCLCALLHLTNCYTDSLGNSSLKLVLATIGSDIELRCLKVLREGSLSYGYTSTKNAICTDTTKDGCGHMWSKNGTILGMAGNTNTSSKLEFSARNSYGYCASFNDTKQNIDFLTVSFNQTAKNESLLKCLVSIMSIKNVTLDDLGVYTCNFSTHYNTFYRYEIDPEIDFVEVALQGTKVQAKEIIYATLAFQGIAYKDLLVQCISTGAKVKWIMFPGVYRYGCYGDDYSETCQETQTPLDGFNTYNHWRSYNYSVLDSSPYEDVYESVLAIQGVIISALTDKIACITEGTTKGKVMTIQIEYNHYYYGDEHYYYSILFTTLLFVLLMIASFILAAVRGRICCQDDRRFLSIAVPVAPHPHVAPLV